jgi:hypothetical protein
MKYIEISFKRESKKKIIKFFFILEAYELAQKDGFLKK